MKNKTILTIIILAVLLTACSIKQETLEKQKTEQEEWNSIKEQFIQIGQETSQTITLSNMKLNNAIQNILYEIPKCNDFDKYLENLMNLKQNLIRTETKYPDILKIKKCYEEILQNSIEIEQDSYFACSNLRTRQTRDIERSTEIINKMTIKLEQATQKIIKNCLPLVLQTSKRLNPPQ